VAIGLNAATQSNVLLNISGNGLGSVVHISSATASSDISILGVSRASGTNTIWDQLGNATLTDAKLGMYILGEPVPSGTGTAGYSRFTTSTNTSVPKWLVGASAPGGSTCGVGDLYSCTGPHSPDCGSHTVWECKGGGTTWHAIE
jgi:hypothetical protein